MKETKGNIGLLTLGTALILLSLISCSSQKGYFQNDNLDIINRDVVPTNNSKNTLFLNRKKGDGMAILKNVEFTEGTIELELKGENNPQKSFIGIAFNIENDSVYEAIYFRPFNFQSDDKTRREHSIQYIYKPDYEWRFLRENYEGKYEAEYSRQPSPDDWFKVRIKINNKMVTIYDTETKIELLSVERLTVQVSNKIGLWVGYNSKGAYRNLKIMTKKTNAPSRSKR